MILPINIQTFLIKRNSCSIPQRRFERTRLYCNADMDPAEIREYCRIDKAGRSLEPIRKMLTVDLSPPLD